ncbi:MAG: NAD(P)/FAD-dependent oxidoreductase, partial [Gammaproteobacteria bacterium]|nr:NAD(P)/FAD-dependent oxidoreductase [Gammaproteobacteria bacterium]
MTKQTIIIGGGHNGLVCACYLAKAGHQVTVIERRALLGGAAVTEAFHPGFRNSTASYTVSLLHPRIISDLKLYDHGLRIVPRKVNNYLPMPSGDAFCTYADSKKTLEEVRRQNPGDVEGLRHFNKKMAAIVPIIRDQMLKTPPSLQAGGLPDLMKLFSLSRHFKKLTADEKSFAQALFIRSPGELLEDYLTTPVIQAWLAFDAMVGHYASPYHPGSGYVLLHHHLGEAAGVPGAWGHAMGGMGAVTGSMAKQAASLGVQFLLESSVKVIMTSKGRASGVELESGECLGADLVVANINPKMLFLDILQTDQVPPAIKAHFQRYKMQSGTFRMNLALSQLPAFDARTPPHY